MISDQFRVKYIDTADCFVYLVSEMLNKFKNKNVEIISQENQKFVVTINPKPYSINKKSIGINPLFGQALGIPEKSTVFLKAIPNLSSLKSVTLSTLNNDDYTVLSSLSETIERNLLSFINVVSVGQKIILWPTKIVTSVVCATPVSSGILQNNTQLEILPPTQRSISNGEQCMKTEEVPIKYNLQARVVPVNQTLTNTILEDPFNIFIWNGSNGSKKFLKNNTIFHVIPMNHTSKKDAKQFYAQLCILDDYYTQFSDMEKIYVNENLIKIEDYETIFMQNSIMATCRIKFGSKIHLEPINNCNHSQIQLKSIKVFIPVGYNQNDFKNDLELFFMSKNDVFISSKVPFLINKDFICYFILEGVDFAFITLDLLHRFMEIDTDPNLFITDYIDNKSSKKDPSPYFDTLFLNLKTDVFDLIRCCFKFQNCEHNFFPENCLIVGMNFEVFDGAIRCNGPTGSGKSTVCQYIVSKISESPYFIKTKFVKCKENYGKSLTTLSKLFSKIFLKLKYYEPSILVLEDVQFLCGKSLTSESQIYFNRMTNMIRIFIENFQIDNYILVIATCDNISNLNENIYSAKGVHIFPNVFELPELTKTNKAEILKFLLEKKSMDYKDINLDEFSAKLDGFVVQDIVDFTNKAVYETVKNNLNRQLNLSILDCTLEAFKPLTIGDVNFKSDSKITFNEIGGLTSAKTILIETIEWPIKFPDLFKSAPIRVQSGILLYGPPGTGKTLLGNAIATHFKIRLITVKGPELLSKFVGASEQSVRKVFETAQNAKPCILFFDEFDSLAPRRGHDNIGVTDRVVNQFLTQLDGVETLEGVYVIAATSRPDLIDPALLRPGRLDKHVYCNIPSEEERFEILQVISKNYEIDENLDMRKVAELTKNFNGADLQSLFYTAQLEIVENSLKGDNDIHGRSCTSTISLKMENILKAFEVTKPTLNDSERSKFEQRYEKFKKNPLKSNTDLKQKVTQA